MYAFSSPLGKTWNMFADSHIFLEQQKLLKDYFLLYSSINYFVEDFGRKAHLGPVCISGTEGGSPSFYGLPIRRHFWTCTDWWEDEFCSQFILPGLHCFIGGI